MTHTSTPLTRRQILAGGTGALFALSAYPALAAQHVVEIIAFAHPPVEAALKPTRQWLSQQGTKVRVVEINMDSPQAQARLKALGLQGHIPVVIVVDGQYRHTNADGRVVEFVEFPASPGTPAGVTSGWSAADVEAAVASKN
jgi:hypothetical protein